MLTANFTRSLLVAALLSVVETLHACEQCRCQGPSPVDALSTSINELFNQKVQDQKIQDAVNPPNSTNPPPTPEARTEGQEHPQPAAVPIAPAKQGYKWGLDTLTEYVRYEHNSIARGVAILEAGRDTHAHRYEFDVTERLSYAVSDDLQLSLAQGYRYLNLREIENPDQAGRPEHSDGPGDLDLGIQYKALHQKPCGSPVDLYIFASVKFPTGVTRNRKPNGDLFETEDQPGTGSFNETGGLSVSKRWGKWAGSAAYGYTHKGEGSQEFKEGDVNRLTISGARQVSPDDWSTRVFLSQGVQGFIENKARDHGEVGPDHGGQFIYAAPSVSVQPNSHLTLTLSGAVPLYQNENGLHQKDNYSLQLNVGIRF